MFSVNLDNGVGSGLTSSSWEEVGWKKLIFLLRFLRPPARGITVFN